MCVELSLVQRILWINGLILGCVGLSQVQRMTWINGLILGEFGSVEYNG
jgi:hypothetical protein